MKKYGKREPTAEDLRLQQLDLAKEKDLREYHAIVEGKRNTPYDDGRGFMTIGIGKNLGKTVDPGEPTYMSEEDMIKQYEKDMQDMRNLTRSKIKNFDKLDQGLQNVAVDLSFNIGPSWTKKFPSAKKALEEGDVREFRRQLLYKNPDRDDTPSEWSSQTGRRSKVIGNYLKKFEES